MALTWQRLRLEARDLVELVLVPGLAAVLPWPLCFRLFRFLSRRSFLYRQACLHALAQARERGWVSDEKEWLCTRRLITLIDHADYYLAITRSDRWMARHLDITGQWPQAGRAALLCTFHWGAGMWGLRHAHASGMLAHALVAPLQGDHFAGRTVLLHYARARTACVSQALGSPTLDVSASLRPALRALRNHEPILAAIDVPSDQVTTSERIDLAGMRARVPRALLRLAVDHGIPVVVYITGIDLCSGRRFLRIMPLGVYTEPEKLVRDVFHKLDTLLLENPAAWHFWGEASRFFEAKTVS